jgi:type IV pilus assembly protein PilW
MRRAPGARATRGVSLIQLLVGMSLGVTVVGALGAFFVQGSRSSREDINVASLLNELGFATGQLGVDLEMAGFWAQAHDPNAIDADGTLAITGTDCGPSGWYRDLRALQILDNATAAEMHAEFPCLAADDLVGGTDVIAIKRVLGRVVGTNTDSSELRAGTLYLRSHDRFGLLYRHGGGTPRTVETPYEDWQYAPVVYYVQRYTVSATESPQVPALCRMTLQSASGGAPAFVRDCVAQGIENLQIEIGVDDDDDGSANYFEPSPDTAQLRNASTARIYLLARSVRPDVNYLNAKSYQIGNMPDAFTPTGAQVHYYRKTLSTEVSLRNPRALQGVAVQ